MANIYGKKALIMRQHVGTAEDEEGNTVDLSITMAHEPVIEMDGLLVVFKWEDLINMAAEEIKNQTNAE